MSQIYKCDKCGNITDEVAAQMLISPRTQEAAALLDVLPSDYDHIRNGKTLDLCIKCVRKLAEVKKQPLTISGTIVDVPKDL